MADKVLKMPDKPPQDLLRAIYSAWDHYGPGPRHMGSPEATRIYAALRTLGIAPGANALIQRWSKEADETPRQDVAGTLDRCAAELSQAVALTDEEREALARLDVDREKPIGPMFVDRRDYDTLRALVTRLTAASDGGGKGETK